MKNSALIIDDDRTTRRVVSRLLKTHFECDVDEGENGTDALRLLKNKTYQFIILDLDMPVMNGHDTIKAIRQNHSTLPIIVLTASEKIEDAVYALKQGANDFLEKPIEEDRFIASIKNTLKIYLLNQDAPTIKQQQDKKFLFSNLIGHDKGLKNYIQTGKKAAACLLPTLITGETGTGKEMFAHAIHGESLRRDHPFIAVNCGALPENLVESTLFGHEKGSFTGAFEKKIGKFREADGGTIFLDEVGDLPLEAQVKLLRVIQQQEVEPVGAGKPVAIDVRILSATHRDLEEDVKQGRFREDLYFRLNVLQMCLPPLRNRKFDLPDLARHFIKKFSVLHQIPPKEISKSAINKLKDYHWPGNIRELENSINRTLAMTDSPVLEAVHFNLKSADHAPADGLIDPLDKDGQFKSFKNLEQEIINLAIEHHNHNMTLTARTLGIAKSTLYLKSGRTDKQKTA